MRKSHPILAGIDTVVPYRTISSDTLYDVKPPLMQVEDFLAAGSVMGVTSYPGVGKTWLTLELCRAIGSGTPFLGRFRAVRGGVLFIGSDSSTEDYARQWSRLTRMTPNAADVYEPVRFLLQSPFMFEDRDEVRKLIATHRKFEWGPLRDTDAGPQRERGFSLIVFDTFSKLTRGNQNDNTEMEENFRHIRWIAEATNTAIVILHHNSKRSEYNDGADWRGAMSQIGALDSWIQLVPSRRRRIAGEPLQVGVQFKKFRGVTPKDFAYSARVFDEFEASLVISDEPITAEQKVDSDALAIAIREYFANNPGNRAPTCRDFLWDRFEGETVGTVTFTDKAKFNTAINNRISAACRNGLLRKSVEQGHTMLYPTEDAKAATPEVPSQPEVPASPQRGDDTPRKRASKKGTKV